MTNSTISNNSAGYNGGGVYSKSGTLTITNSKVSGNTATSNGGGVHSESVTIANSTIAGNSASDYGGLNANGTVTISKSTISGNGGVRVAGGMTASGIITITNSTISGNSASEHGGGVRVGGTVTITNCTISGNSAVGSGDVYECAGKACGGGIYNRFGTLTLARTLVSGNTAFHGREVFNGTDATVTAANLNLFGHNGNAGVTGFSPGPTDIVPRKSLGAILNPNLANNGGSTQTHALVRGSPAIDSVTDGTCPRRPEISGASAGRRMVTGMAPPSATSARSNGDGANDSLSSGDGAERRRGYRRDPCGADRSRPHFYATKRSLRADFMDAFDRTPRAPDSHCARESINTGGTQ